MGSFLLTPVGVPLENPEYWLGYVLLFIDDPAPVFKLFEAADVLIFDLKVFGGSY